MGALRRRPGQVMKGEVAEEEGRLGGGKRKADTRSGAIHRWTVDVGLGLTGEGRLTLT